MKYRFVWGILFIFVYSLLALFAVGGGHGTYVFFAPLMPFGIGAVVYPMIFHLTGYLSSNWIRILYVMILFSHCQNP